jgi:hypothetical protein
MPSPFPGMDPFLEAPNICPDLHDALAAEMRAELNHLISSGDRPERLRVLPAPPWRGRHDRE